MEPSESFVFNVEKKEITNAPIERRRVETRLAGISGKLASTFKLSAVLSRPFLIRC